MKDMGARVTPRGTRFRVWAPQAQRVELLLAPPLPAVEMRQVEPGVFEVLAAQARAGTLYHYRLDGTLTLPDPVSRFQPQGVHGPSQVVDATSYAWGDRAWQGVAYADWVIYELHVGAFSPEGTFQGVTARLPYLRDLGITAVELMPVADFPGRWNWGYDPAAFYAPARCYGTPDDLRRLVDAAHQAGIAMVLDVVYNHLGPDGAYMPSYSKSFFSQRHHTDWGPAVNLDGEGAAGVRRFIYHNALHWLTEYHFDGLRLDATHALQDDSPTHILAELSAAVQAVPGPPRRLIAEDPRNDQRLLHRREQGGYGLDGMWIDDFHHQVRCTLTGEQESYYADYTPGAAALGTVATQGWLFTGQMSKHLGKPRGTPCMGVRPDQLVYCIQNHDQVGNRALGDRLSESISGSQYRAVSALLLFLPEMPMLFMGQEWATRTPFQFFTDHVPELGEKVSAGRKAEFEKFAAFSHQDVPDPQDPATFARSCLLWEEMKQKAHAQMHRLYRELLTTRRGLRGSVSALHGDDHTLVLQRGLHVLVVALTDDVVIPFPTGASLQYTSEDADYASFGKVPVVRGARLHCPSAVAAFFECKP